MPETPIRFGTDGWRAIIADTFTEDNVRICAQAVADHFREHGQGSGRLVVGYDTRFRSGDFALEAARVLAGNGFTVELADRPAPTPAISNHIVASGADGGMVITSSHNPYQWNGIKVKPHYGGSASPEVVSDIEARLQPITDSPSLIRHVAADNDAIVHFNPLEGYLKRLGELVDLPRIRSAGIQVAVDPMYGTGVGLFTELLEGSKTTVREVHTEQNPRFPGLRAPEPIDQNLGEFMLLVASDTFDVGIATDGDSDRVGLVDEKGGYVDQLRTFALLIEFLLGEKQQRGAIVKSVTTTDMARLLGQHYNVPVIETPVGFKHIGPIMMREDALIGGEESGGYGFRGHLPERDGILAGLMLLEFMAMTGKSPAELLERVFAITGPHYYARRDFQIGEADRAHVLQTLNGLEMASIGGTAVQSKDTTDGWRFMLDNGWLLYRLSGTEPLVRIYTEVRDQAQVRLVLDEAQERLGIGG